jgi:putative ABC transport system permease protein
MEIRPIFSALLRNKSGLALIVLQVAITLAVVCNSLFIVLGRFERMGRPSGIDEANTFVIASLGFAQGYDLRNSMREDLDMIRSLPGVVTATTTNTVPTSNGGWSTGVDVQPLDESGTRQSKSTALYFVDEQGADAFGVKIVEGRNFTPDEIAEFTPETGIQAKVVVITEALGKALFPDESAVGKQVYGLGNDDESVTIIGVMERMQQPWLGARQIEQSALIPTRLIGDNYARYLVRTEPGQRDRLMKEVEQKLQENNPGRIVRGLESVQSIRAGSYRSDRAMMFILLGVMGALILVTGAGIVGLASFWVTRRIKQIGTRRALGARRFNIRRYFQTENGLMVAMGVALGILFTYGFNLWLMQQYQAPRLPWFYLPIGAATVFALGQLAVMGPAGRAAKVSPAVATRSA